MSEEEPAAPPDPGEPAHRDDGLDLARAIARGLARGGQRGRPRARARRGRPAGDDVRTTGAVGRMSGAHPDDRDPQTLESSIERLVAQSDWDDDLRVHGVFSRWSAIVGREVAEHCTPETFDEGRLVVRTDSTAWATQLKLLAPQLVGRLNEILGDGTVRVIVVRPPRGPTWKAGRFRVPGAGPRDTYG